MYEEHSFNGHTIVVMQETPGDDSAWLYDVPRLASTLAFADTRGLTFPRKSAALAHAIDFIRTQTNDAKHRTQTN